MPSPQKNAPYSNTTLFKRLCISQTTSLLLPHICYPLYQRNSFTLKFSKQIYFNSCSLLLMQDVQHICGLSAKKSLNVFLKSSITAAEITLTVQCAINCPIVWMLCMRVRACVVCIAPRGMPAIIWSRIFYLQVCYQKKNTKILKYTKLYFASCFVWVWNLV